VKPIIGVICRKSISPSNLNISYYYDSIKNAIEMNGGLLIGISPYKEYINFCDGIILEGGDTFDDNILNVIKYIYDIDKPLLGICLGMQEMAYCFNGDLVHCNNHKSKTKYTHLIYLNKNTKLYNIFNTDKLLVNSRHKDCINKTSLSISSISEDGVIESVEDSSKKFFIGVQWHPESMIEYDEIQNNIFKKFIGACMNESI